MPLSRLEYLFSLYLELNYSKKEEEELMALLADSKNELAVQKLIEKIIEKTASETRMPNEVAALIMKNILQKDKAYKTSVKSKKIVALRWTRVAAAAVVILFVSGISFWVFNKAKIKEKTTISIVRSGKASSIVPGGNHAILTMANGSTIVLDSVQNGNIQGGIAKISKQNGLLVYNRLRPSKADVLVNYNTVTTPCGGQYQLVLSDGSKVWLNASSSLHFPVAFDSKTREVELTGEAYFEVAKNKEKPFHVNVNGMQVEVLGTHFNVNAYADEGEIKTSLLEGSVKIKKGSKSGLLKPGQQAILNNSNADIEITKPDMDEVMAWKNGLFEFDGADITTIMRQIGRWYNVEIVYVGKVPARSFEGKISRDAQLADLLKILELSDVKFTVEDRKIIVQ